MGWLKAAHQKWVAFFSAGRCTPRPRSADVLGRSNSPSFAIPNVPQPAAANVSPPPHSDALQRSQREVLRTPRKPVFVMNRPHLGHSSPCRRRAVLSRLLHHQMPMTAPAAHTPKRTHAPRPRTLRPSAVMARAQMAKHTVVIPDSAAFGTRTSFRKALIRDSSSCRVVGIKRLNQTTLNAVANGNYALIHQRVNRDTNEEDQRCSAPDVVGGVVVWIYQPPMPRPRRLLSNHRRPDLRGVQRLAVRPPGKAAIKDAPRFSGPAHQLQPSELQKA